MVSDERAERIVCGQIDLVNKCFKFVTGDGTFIYGPLSMFKPSGDGTTPDYEKFKITDYGNTVAFGDYEVAAEVLV